jgi:hypothetical protein
MDRGFANWVRPRCERRRPGCESLVRSVFTVRAGCERPAARSLGAHPLGRPTVSPCNRHAGRHATRTTPVKPMASQIVLAYLRPPCTREGSRGSV